MNRMNRPNQSIMQNIPIRSRAPNPLTQWREPSPRRRVTTFNAHHDTVSYLHHPPSISPTVRSSRSVPTRTTQRRARAESRSRRHGLLARSPHEAPAGWARPAPGERANVASRPIGHCRTPLRQARSNASRSSGASSRSPAFAESTAVAGRRDPGIGMMFGAFASSQARATRCGETP